MDILKKGKEDYVPTMNKVNKLDDWANYLLGLAKTADYAVLVSAIKRLDWEMIEAYNAMDIWIVYGLYTLILNMKGE